MKCVLVFGVFDLLHPGHVFFLKQAAKKGTKLVVVVARDSVVKALKKKTPRHSERMRCGVLRRLPFVSKAILGDKKQGTYAVVKRIKPDGICLGYDQDWLRRDISEKMAKGLFPRIPVFRMAPHHPKKFKTSILADGHM